MTVLFTDAVGSTEVLSRVGDERFDDLQAAHLGLLRDAAGANAGREVKSLGDGVMVAFSGAAEALACAVEMQKAIDSSRRRGEDGMPLRVGVSAGDVTVDEDGDLHGTAVVEAARLCAAAAPGQVLGTETVRVLAGSRGGHAFTALGPVELKGLPEPIAVVEVGWSPAAEGGELAPVPLPPLLSFESAWTFVGRANEVDKLEGLWQEAVAGVRVALLGGEPGAGKTRLAREVAVRAHAEGALVLFGRVDEDLVVAYQPFAEALRHYLASVDEPTRERVLLLRRGVLARLVPELVEAPSQGQVEPWAIFEALVDWLANEATRRPVVLVLDDLHWAAAPTLQALMHLVRSTRLTRLLIVVTYRDTELDRKHPLAACLADLRREEGVERIAVRGLDEDGVAAFVEAARGGTLDEQGHELAKVLSDQTQGNPFFVGQVLRHLAESGVVEQVDGRWVGTAAAEGFVVPEGVRDVVGRRISRLSAKSGELLMAAAVIGPQFDAAIAAEVAGQSIAEALDGFDEAIAARLLLEAGLPGHLRFPHALVRQTLEDELSTLRRLHLHREIGHALERRFGEADSAVADLAHHFGEAAAVGEGDRAARYVERAAVLALERAAPEQAVELFERALEVLPGELDPTGTRRDELFAQLAHCLWVIFDSARLEGVCHRWLALARDLGDESMTLIAACWLGNSFIFRGAPSPSDAVALGEALRVDPGSLDLDGRRRFSLRGTWCLTDPMALRALLLSTMATDWAWGVPLGVDLPLPTPLALADEALRLAGESADPAVEDDVRFGRISTMACVPDPEVLLREAQHVNGSGYRTSGGGSHQVGLALARLGRFDDLSVLSERMIERGEETGDLMVPALARVWQTLAAITQGRFEDAQRLAELMLAPFPEGNAAFQLAYGFASVGRFIAMGEPNEARNILEAIASVSALDLSALLAAVAVAQGDLVPARSVLDEWHASGHRLPDDLTRTGRLWDLTECAHAVGDAEAASQLHQALGPYDGQLIVHGYAFVPASSAFTLGKLADAQGDRDRAQAHYSDALAFEEHCGATALAARTGGVIASIA
jgi:class 3 adenylate cyclase/tetratricopeptide (TPR) repeat protein